MQGDPQMKIDSNAKGPSNRHNGQTVPRRLNFQEKSPEWSDDNQYEWRQCRYHRVDKGIFKTQPQNTWRRIKLLRRLGREFIECNTLRLIGSSTNRLAISLKVVYFGNRSPRPDFKVNLWHTRGNLTSSRPAALSLLPGEWLLSMH